MADWTFAPVCILSGGRKSAWGWPACWCPTRPCCCWTSRPTTRHHRPEWLKNTSQYAGGMLIVSMTGPFDRAEPDHELDPLTHSLARLSRQLFRICRPRRGAGKYAQMYHEQQEQIARWRRPLNPGPQNRKGNDQLSLPQKGQEGGPAGDGAQKAHRAHDRVRGPPG